jgi:methionyl-tRNA formyltransferase
MLLAEREAIRTEDTTATLHDRLAALGGRLIVEALELAACGGLKATPQPADGVSYAHKIEKDEAAINWSQPAEAIERRVRAFDPFPGAHFKLDGQSIKLWRAEVADGNGAPGALLGVRDDALIVACGERALALHELQRPGGRRLPAASLIQALELRGREGIYLR